MTFGEKFEGLTATGLSFEYEALVAGSLQPASIAGIEVYDKNSPHRNPGLSAKRVEEDGKVSIVVEDRRGEFVVQRTYTYNTDVARFELTSEIATQIPSITQLAEPTPFGPDLHKDLLGLIDKFKKIYYSPFKNENIHTILDEFISNKNKILAIDKEPLYENILNLPFDDKNKLFEKKKEEIIPKIYNPPYDELINKYKEPPKKK